MTTTTKPAITIKRGQTIDFERFNGAKARGVATGRKLAGKRGLWYDLRVDWQDEPLKIRAGQVLRIDGVRVH